MGFTCALRVTTQAVVSYTALPPLRKRGHRSEDLPQNFHIGIPHAQHVGYAAFAAYPVFRTLASLQASLHEAPVRNPVLCGLIAYAVYFCCTVLGVASTRRYLASCPVKPGLSSPAAFRLLQQRPSVRLKTYRSLSDFRGNFKS